MRRSAVLMVCVASALVGVGITTAIFFMRGIEPNWQQKFDEYAQSIPEFPVEKPGEVPVTATNKNHLRLTEELENRVAFQPNADALWPGALVQGDSLKSGILKPIPIAPADRSPTTLTIDLTGPAGKCRRVDQPDQGATLEAISDLVNLHLGTDTVQPARVSFAIQRAYSMEQAMLKLGASVEWLGGSVSADFKKGRTEGKSLALVRFTQTYFVVSCAPPSRPSAVFRSGPAIEVARRLGQFGENNPPAYVASVVYGRELWLRIESKESDDVLDASLKASFKAFGTSNKMSVDYGEHKVLKESTVNALVVGGAFTDAVELSQGKLGKDNENLFKYLAAGANYSKQSPALPISYQIRYLGSGNVAKLSRTTEYTIPSKRRVTGFQVTYKTMDGDKDGALAIGGGHGRGRLGARVDAEIRLDGKKVGEVGIGDQEKYWWPDGTTTGPFPLGFSEDGKRTGPIPNANTKVRPDPAKITGDVSELDVNRCVVVVTQSPLSDRPRDDPHWRMRFRVEFFFDDNPTPVEVLKFDDPLRRRDDPSKSYFTHITRDESEWCFDLEGPRRSTPEIPLRRP